MAYPYEQEVSARYAQAQKANEAFIARLLQHHPDQAVAKYFPPPEPEQPEPEPAVAEPQPVAVVTKSVKPLWFGIISDEPVAPLRPSIRKIIKIVGRHYDTDVIHIISERRPAHLVFVRHVAMYLAKQLTLRSLPEIGRQFGGRDHTTILHAVHRIRDRLATDSKLAETIEQLKKEIVG